MASEAPGVRDVSGDAAHQVQDIGPLRPSFVLFVFRGRVAVHTAQAPGTWAGRKASDQTLGA